MTTKRETTNYNYSEKYTAFNYTSALLTQRGLQLVMLAFVRVDAR